jgi:hypothetical protein
MPPKPLDFLQTAVQDRTKVHSNINNLIAESDRISDFYKSTYTIDEALALPFDAMTKSEKYGKPYKYPVTDEVWVDAKTGETLAGDLGETAESIPLNMAHYLDLMKRANIKGALSSLFTGKDILTAQPSHFRIADQLVKPIQKMPIELIEKESYKSPSSFQESILSRKSIDGYTEGWGDKPGGLIAYLEPRTLDEYEPETDDEIESIGLGQYFPAKNPLLDPDTIRMFSPFKHKFVYDPDDVDKEDRHAIKEQYKKYRGKVPWEEYDEETPIRNLAAVTTALHEPLHYLVSHPSYESKPGGENYIKERWEKTGDEFKTNEAFKIYVDAMIQSLLKGKSKPELKKELIKLLSGGEMEGDYAELMDLIK